MTDSFLRLLTWVSPAFPTGGFAWSHGLEFAVESGDVTSGETLRNWLEALLAHGSGRNDAILLRAGYRARGEELREVASFAAAVAPSRELHAETLEQGGAFLRAAVPWMPADLAAAFEDAGPVVHPVALGALAAAHGIGEDEAVGAWLHGFVANLVSAGVRLVPLGQSAGLAVQHALEATIAATVAATRNLSVEDIGGCCLRAEIASMRHETQYTRLFRS